MGINKAARLIVGLSRSFAAQNTLSLRESQVLPVSYKASLEVPSLPATSSSALLLTPRPSLTGHAHPTQGRGTSCALRPALSAARCLHGSLPRLHHICSKIHFLFIRPGQTTLYNTHHHHCPPPHSWPSDPLSFFTVFMAVLLICYLIVLIPDSTMYVPWDNNIAFCSLMYPNLPEKCLPHSRPSLNS